MHIGCRCAFITRRKNEKPQRDGFFIRQRSALINLYKDLILRQSSGCSRPEITLCVSAYQLNGQSAPSSDHARRKPTGDFIALCLSIVHFFGKSGFHVIEHRANTLNALRRYLHQCSAAIRRVRHFYGQFFI